MDLSSIKDNKTTVWFDWDEWKCIYQKLYSQDEKEQQHGIKRLTAWRSRNKLPISIEVTGYFIELNLNIDKRSQNELELGLSMAISRMVNGFIDSTRDMLRINKINMFKKANELNLPTMFVDIRHESSHGKLPPLQLLKPVSKTALDWLNDYYWKPQSTTLESSFQKIRLFLNDYKNKYDCNSDNETNEINLNSFIKESSLLFDDISSDILGNILVPVLLDEDYLVTNEYLSSTASTYGHIPGQLKRIYQPLLQFLHMKYPHFLIIILYLSTDRICKFKFPPPLSKKSQKLKRQQQKDKQSQQHQQQQQQQMNDETDIIYNGINMTKEEETKTVLMTHWVLYFIEQFKISAVKQQQGLVNYKIELPYRWMLEKCIENIHSKYCQKILNVLMKKDLNDNQSKSKKNQSSTTTTTTTTTTALATDSNNTDIQMSTTDITTSGTTVVEEEQVNYSVDQVLSTLKNSENNSNSGNTTTTTTTTTSSTSIWKFQKQWISSPIGVLPPPNDQNSSSFDLPDDLDDNFDHGNFVEVVSIDNTTTDPSLTCDSLLISLKSLYPNLNKNTIIRKDFISNNNNNNISNENEIINNNNNNNNNNNITTPTPNVATTEIDNNIKMEDNDVIEISHVTKKQKTTTATTSTSTPKKPQKGKSKSAVLNDFMFWNK